MTHDQIRLSETAVLALSNKLHRTYQRGLRDSNFGLESYENTTFYTAKDSTRKKKVYCLYSRGSLGFLARSYCMGVLSKYADIVVASWSSWLAFHIFHFGPGRWPAECINYTESVIGDIVALAHDEVVDAIFPTHDFVKMTDYRILSGRTS